MRKKRFSNRILKQGIPLQNMQTAYATQYGKKNNQPNGKSGQRSKWIFVRRGRADGREAHEKMLSHHC